MALFVEQGTISVPASTGTFKVPIVPGGGETVKAMILWWGGRGDDNAGVNSRQSIGFVGTKLLGFGDSWSQGAVGWMARNNQNPTQVSGVNAAGACLVALNSDAGSPSIRCQMYVMDIDEEGVEFNVGTRDSNSCEVYYMALGGSDIERAYVQELAVPGGTGNVDYQTQGPVAGVDTFQPNMLFVAGSGVTGGPTGGSDIRPFFGGAVSSTERRCLASRDRDAVTPAVAEHALMDNKVAHELNGASADFVQFNSDGFRLNWTAAGTGSKVQALAIRGARWKIGDFTSPASAGAKNVTGVGFAPSAAMFFGTGNTTALNTAGTPRRFMVGGATAQDEAGTSDSSSTAATSGTGHSQDSSRAIIHHSPAQALVEKAYHEDWDSDGFTMIYETTVSGARYGFAAVAGNVALTGATGIASAETFGTGGAVVTGVVGDEGITSGETFGEGGVVAGPLGQGSAGIPSGETFGIGGEVSGGLTAQMPTPTPLWRMVLADLAGNPVGELFDVRDRRFSFMLNHPGTATFEVDLINPMAAELLTRKEGLILIYRGTTLRMVAELMTMEVAGTGGEQNEHSISCTALETMWVRLQNRLVGKSNLGVNTLGMNGADIDGNIDRGLMVWKLLDTINAESPTGINFGSLQTTSTINAANAWHYKPFLELLQEVSGTASGFDFRQVPIQPAGTGVTGSLDIRANLGVARPNVIYEYGFGKANAKDYKWIVSRENLINRGIALPSGFPQAGALEVATVSDATSITARGLREAVVSSDLLEYDLRQQLATEHVALRKLPMERFFFQPALNAEYVPLDDFELGDTITGRVYDEGILRLAADVRVYGVTVEPDNLGNENVSLTLVDE